MNTTIILLIIYHTIVIYAILNVKKMNRFYHIFEQKRRKGRKSHSVSKENKIKILHVSAGFLVGAGGFGPPKSLTTDLQSAPFGRSGTLPIIKPRTQNAQGFGAGDRSRTNNLLITNQLLCH